MSSLAVWYTEIFNELHLLSIPNKILFCERLLFEITIANRAIWSDEEYNYEDKVEAFKWSNELCHRVWHLIFELKDGEDDNTMERLSENIIFCSRESKMILKNVRPLLSLIIDDFRKKDA